MLSLLSRASQSSATSGSTAVQTIFLSLGNYKTALRLPDPNSEVIPGVVWGRSEHLFSPAFWYIQVLQHAHRGTMNRIQLGDTLRDEVAACLLGGYGMPASLGLAAFARLKQGGLLEAPQAAESIEEALSEPLEVNGTPRRYRFPRQKARYLSLCLSLLEHFDEPESDRELRDALSEMPGIGLKTASWVVRNHRRSNDVAVLDVHIQRAGQYVGVFSYDEQPQRHYRKMETRFLEFAEGLGVETWLLDAVMWDVMRVVSNLLPKSPYSTHASSSGY